MLNGRLQVGLQGGFGRIGILIGAGVQNFEATDILNVHAQVSDMMRIGWPAADLGIPVCLGNTFLEMGVHMAAALPPSLPACGHRRIRSILPLESWY